MKIEKFTKLKSGQYKLNLDNNTNILLHEDLILKYELLIYKEIDIDKQEQLLEENKSYIAYDLALNYLKKKMRTKKEIRDHLLKKGIDEQLINDSIKKLQTQGYVNDLTYSRAFINDRINLSNDGPYKIKEQLLKLGINEDIASQELEAYDQTLEKIRIEKLIDKHLRINHNKSEISLKKKTIDQLVNLGYSREMVISLVEDVSVNDEDIKKKEYEKLYKKLSKKYSGKELEYKIKYKLYQKGFRID